MRIFVTGATGFIGSAVVGDLLAAGHQVLGLTRSDAGEAALRARGAEAHRGDLSDPAGLAAGARASDGVIHLAFDHDFSKYMEAGEQEQRVIQAMVEALAGTGKPLVAASGTGVVPPGGTERDAALTEGFSMVRGIPDTMVVAAAERGVRSSVVRLPPSVAWAGQPGPGQPDDHREGARVRLFGLCRRRRQPLAGGEPQRRGAPLRPRAGGRAGRLAPACGGRGRRAAARDRSGHRRGAGAADPQSWSGARKRASTSASSG